MSPRGRRLYSKVRNRIEAFKWRNVICKYNLLVSFIAALVMEVSKVVESVTAKGRPSLCHPWLKLPRPLGTVVTASFPLPRLIDGWQL